MRYCCIRIDETDTLVADAVAFRRQHDAMRLNRPAKNGAPTDWASALKIHRCGARGEISGRNYLWPVSWHAISARIGRLADYEDWIDAKCVPEARHSLIVQRDDPPDWAYLLILGHDHPNYTMVGWCWGREAQQKRFWRTDTGRPAYFVGQGDRCDGQLVLRDPEELIAELRRRQNKAKVA